MNLERIAQRVANPGRIRTGGTIEFKKDQGPVRRDVRVKEFEWSSESLRDLAKILWAGQRAHSYAMAALRIFSKMPSSEFSPDGLLGGRGYIQSVKDMRSSLANTVELLSSFTDTVHDEVNADHWAASEKKAGIEGIVSDAENVKSNPESFVEKEFEDESEEEPLVNPAPKNPEVDGKEEEQEDEEEEEPGSQLPPDVPRTSSVAEYDKFAVAFDGMLARTASQRMAGGALDELPFRGPEPEITDRDLGGPRAFPLGPAAGGELGNFDDPCSSQDPNDSAMVEQELLLDNGLFLPQVPLTLGDGDDFKLSSRISANLPDGYSWLPGADNRKSMNWYEPGITAADMDWMEKHCQPDIPKGILPEKPEADSESLWDGVRVY